MVQHLDWACRCCTVVEFHPRPPPAGAHFEEEAEGRIQILQQLQAQTTTCELQVPSCRQCPSLIPSTPGAFKFGVISNTWRAFCETEINECDPNPCKHGGSCKDSIGHFKCICPVGFEGQQCEVDIDACLLHNITCSPGAQCVDKPYELAYMCGRACQENAELCANGGRCFHDEDNQGYQCVCPPGWTGPDCLENINDCEESWCNNGGTCEDGINGYRYEHASLMASFPINLWDFARHD
ncbi:protein eyes shut homolog [Pogona vitticeps]